MMLKDQKTSIIEANRTHETDTGSPEVQVAILTERINQLTAATTSALAKSNDGIRSPQGARNQKEDAGRATGFAFAP